MRRNSHKTVGAESPQVKVCVMCGDSRATKIGVRSSGDDVQSFLVIRYACRSQIIVRLHIKMRLHPNQGRNWEPDLYSRHRDHIEIVGKYLYRRLDQLCLNIRVFFVEGLLSLYLASIIWLFLFWLRFHFWFRFGLVLNLTVLRFFLVLIYGIKEGFR